MFSSKTLSCALFAASCLGVLVAATPALACGGLFCNTSQPVNQTAERIIFVDHGDDRVTAVVEILYSGPAEEFSWLVPVPGIPEVGVSSGHVLDNLQSFTRPQYNLNVRVEGNCAQPSARGGGGNNVADFGGSQDAGFGADMDSGVNVVASGAAGPYDYQVIQVDPNLDNPAQVAAMWLEDNGYDVAGPQLLQEYLDAGMNFLGFKLQKGNTAGSIRPVTMSYNTDHPMIPIKLTAVAAQDDMGVLVWVMGQHRAIPTNYRHLVLNEAAIDWFNPNNNYDDVISLAADEAGGQGFVTEYAGTTDLVRDQLVRTSLRERWESLRQDSELNDRDLLSGLTDSFGTWDGYLEVFADKVPLPEDITPAEFLQCPNCYGNQVLENLEGFDRADFLAAMQTLVIDPAFNTQDLVDERPYMTRFYSTLSAPEMTLDPEFEFNPDLADISNVHTADQIIECNSSATRNNAPWRIEFANGQILRGQSNQWPVNDGDLPANERVQQLSTTGQPETITDNTARIQDGLAALSPPPLDRQEDPKASGCACTTPASPPQGRTTWPVALLALGMGMILRRKIKHL